MRTISAWIACHCVDCGSSKRSRSAPLFGVGLALALCAISRAEVQTLVEHPIPDRIRPQVCVFAADWLSHIPPGSRLNAPAFLSTVYPGQKIALGLFAEGPNRDKAFDGVTIDVHVSGAQGRHASSRTLKPTLVRKIKAEGADIIMSVLNGVGLSEADKGKLEEPATLVTLAVFVPDWTVPLVENSTSLDVGVEVSGTSTPVMASPAHLNIKTNDEWLRAPELPLAELDRQFNRYGCDVPPGQLISWFVSVSKGGFLKAPPIDAFFALKFQSNVVARDAAIAACSALDPKVATDLIRCLRRAGLDVQRLVPKASPEMLAAADGVEPLADPRDFSTYYGVANAGAMHRVATLMDQCWGGWNATGDKTYLRTLVELLNAAADFPALKHWQETRGGAQGLNEHVAKGLAYQIAGWSIGAFQRTDPLVADWLDYWQHDGETPAALRAEIASLPVNPAFRRK